MRLSLLYNPFVILDRLAIASRRRRRRKVLSGTPAASLGLGHLDSLELLQLLKDNPPAVIHDIGANAGHWTCLAKSLYPRAHIDAFEPLTQFDSVFKEHTAHWPANEIHLHKLALGANSGEAVLNVTDFADASSLLALSKTGATEFNVKPMKQVTIPIERLDDLIAAGKASQPDLLKLDVQGYELEVLRGADNALKNARAVICEVSTRVYYEGQPLIGEVIQFFEARGYRLHAFGANLGPGAVLAQTDALFLRE